MSIKVNTFASIITNPLNVHNFLVTIPSSPLGSIVVSSSEFPSEKLQEVVKYYQGHQIAYPTIPKTGGSWKVTLPESDSGIIKRELDRLKNMQYDQASGIFVPNIWESVAVTARDLSGRPVFSCAMIGCWLMGRDSVNLSNDDASKSWDWTYEFRYQWLEDIDFFHGGSKSPIV